MSWQEPQTSNVQNDNDETRSTESESTITTVIKELQLQHATDPKTEHVSLRGRHLAQEDASQVLAFLATHFPDLRHLDLCDNDMREVPYDIGTRLPKLVALNLSNNPLQCQNGALRTLGATLQRCRCLKSLSLTLSSVAGERDLLAMLPQLRILNGCPLSSIKNSAEGNSTMPNASQDFQHFYASLQSDDESSVRPVELPASISDDRTDWCKFLKANQWQVPEKPATCSEPTLLQVVPTETFLEQLKSVVKAFHDCHSPRQISRGSKGNGLTQIDHHVELLAQQVKRQESRDCQSEVSQAMIQTRWNLLEVCAMFGSQKVAQLDAGVGSGFGLLLAMQKQLFATMQQQSQLQSRAQSEKDATFVAQNQQQVRKLQNVATKLESELASVQLALQQEIAHRQQVELENIALKRGGKIDSSNLITPRVKATSDTQAIRQLQKSNNNHSTLVNLVKPRGNLRAPCSPVRTSSLTTGFARSLSSRQLVDVINCVYASKAKYDARAMNTGAPRETMEQHLYTYLNTRFGLPKLITEYANAVWKAVEQFASQENDAAVFQALLCNQIDEGFLEKKRKGQLALVEMLKAYFAAKYPSKQGKAIAAMVQSRVDGLLYEEEWRSLVTSLYNAQDSATLLNLVQERAKESQSMQLFSQTAQGNDKLMLSLRYRDFTHVLFDYQLQERLELLHDFCTLFNEVDTGHGGVLNRVQFITLTQRLVPTKSEPAVATLVKALDPFHLDVITFSDAAIGLLPDIRRHLTLGQNEPNIM